MADTSKTKTKNEWISWRNKPYDLSRSDEAQRRAERWQAFCDFIRENRASIVSSPGGRTAVIEVMEGSTLPAKLAELGYNVVSRGTVTRITGAPASNPLTERLTGAAPNPFTECGVIEVTLPWAARPPPTMKKRPA